MARSLNAQQIPKGWQYDLLDNLAERCSGHTPSKSFPEYWNGGVKWISLADSRRLDKGYVYETDKEISTEGIKNSSANVHPAGTVVISRDAGIGKSGVMAEPMAVSQHFIAWKCDNEQKMNNWYLYNWLQFNKQEFERQAVGSTIKTIGLPFFKKLKIAAPPYPEQQKIAKILSTWDKAISTTERLIENSTQHKKALMQQLLTGKKRLLDESGKRFEGEWKDATVSSFGKVVTGSTPPKNDSSNYDGNISWATAEDFKRKYVSNTKVKLTESGAAKARVVPKGSVLVTCIASIGKNAIANENLATNQQINSVVINKNNSNEFFYYLIEFNIHKLLAWAGTTAVPILNKTSFEKVEFIVPNLKEQQKIATVLTNADKEIELLEHQLADLQQEKKALMQVLLTGKKRVLVDGEGV